MTPRRGGTRKWSELERPRSSGRNQPEPEQYPPPAGVPALVRDVACPTCGAEPFQACREGRHALPASESHPRRRIALGDAQRAAGWQGGERLGGGNP